MLSTEHIHPMIVHFPIVLIILLACYDLFTALRGHSISGRTVNGNITTVLAVLAGVSALLAMVFGGMALEHAEAAGFSSEIAETHEELGELVAILLAGWGIVRLFLWFRKLQLSGVLNLLGTLISVALTLLVLYTAYFGGQLVYDLGVNVTKVAG